MLLRHYNYCQEYFLTGWEQGEVDAVMALGLRIWRGEGEVNFHFPKHFMQDLVRDPDMLQLKKAAFSQKGSLTGAGYSHMSF